MGTASFAVFAAFLFQLSCSVSTEEVSSCSPAFSSDTYEFIVHRKDLNPSMRLGRVEFSDCTGRRMFLFSSEDSQFSVQTDGVVKVKRPMALHDGRREFFVHAWDSNGVKKTARVHVFHQKDHHHSRHHHGDGHHQHEHHQTESPSVQDAPSRLKRETVEEDVPVIYFPKATEGLRRRKREWVTPDIYFPENDFGPFPKKVSQIRSSMDKDRVVSYSITGLGADQPPVGLFTIDRYTGIMYVTQPLDREVKANYSFMAYARADNGPAQTETPMEINVIVIDMNDNRPAFTQDMFMGEVAESSPLNFDILQVKATDADQEGSRNTAVRYRIMSQEPKVPSENMFEINPLNGFIRVNAKGLDRETNPKYTLEVKAADSEGEGLTALSTVILTVTDSNDNAPMYTQDQFSVTVPGNKTDAPVVTMLVTDKDDAHTPTWNAKFTIVDGNNDGLFTVRTGANKQEGIITTAKGLDSEKTSTHRLLVVVENEVPFAVPLPTATATVIVTVSDVV